VEGAAGATEDDLPDPQGAFLGAVVDRVRGGSRRSGAATRSLQRTPRLGDEIGVALDLLDGGFQANVLKPLRRVSREGGLRCRQASDDRLEAGMGDAREETGSIAGYGRLVTSPMLQ
jgi:hypothetical protein